MAASTPVNTTLNSTLQNVTSRTEDQAARLGKFAITGESISTVDVPPHEVLANWESRNDKAITKYRYQAESEADQNTPSD